MSQHPSFKLNAGATGKKRNVLKRFERIELMKKRGTWKEGRRVMGLPKTRVSE
ncbi:MAG TPA: small basic protein [Opitutales bacterium]|jgi:small basic protein (TIGR04137 family)|nr:small basic protein [Opitutales bacterium]